jgi:hypothetical protein
MEILARPKCQGNQIIKGRDQQNKGIYAKKCNYFTVNKIGKK